MLHVLTAALQLSLPAVSVTPLGSGDGTPPPAAIVAAEAMGLDAHYTLAWGEEPPPAPLWLRLLDAAGETVAETDVEAIAGATTDVFVEGAFRALDSSGFSYRAVIEGADGTALSSPYDVQVLLDCSDPTACELSLRRGIYADGMMASPALSTALDELYANGSENLVGDLIEGWSELTGEAYIFGWHQARAVQHEGVGCRCVWTAVYEPSDDDDGTGCGGTKYLEGNAACSEDTITFEGTSRLSHTLRCFEPSMPTDRTVELTTGGSVVLSQAHLQACNPPCAGTVTHQVAYSGSTWAVADSRGHAFANLDASFSVGGGLTVQDNAGADAHDLTSSTQVDFELMSSFWTGTATAPTTATVTTKAQVGLYQSYMHPDSVRAMAAAGFSWGTVATASCAAPETMNLSVNQLGAGSQDLQHPTDTCPLESTAGTRISILVGECP